MRRGQRASCSSESEEHQRPWSTDSDDQFTPSGCSSDEDSSSVSDAEAMKRSQRFSGSFSFEEDQQLKSKNEGREGEARTSCGLSVSEVVESELVTSCAKAEKRGIVCDANRPRSSLFRPQGLWLAMTRCLSLRWVSMSRQTNRKLVYRVDLDHEDTQSPTSSDSTRESSGSSDSDDKDVSLLRHKEKDVSGRGVENVPPPRRGISHSSPRVPRTRRASDLVLASTILEKEMFLRVELVDSGDEGGDLRYRAEWKLSDRSRELAEGVWLSRSQNVID